MVSQMVPNASIDALVRDLAHHPPRRIPRLPRFVFAAVAVVLVPEGDDYAMVFIGRPARRGDRWSGDVAFPGGLAAASAEASVETARREAQEEIGLVLGDPIGALSDRVTLAPGASRPMRVRPVLFVLEAATAFRPDPREVEAVYVRSSRELLVAERRRVERSLFGIPLRFEGRALGGHVLWGLTASMVAEVGARIARSRGQSG